MLRLWGRDRRAACARLGPLAALLVGAAPLPDGPRITAERTQLLVEAGGGAPRSPYLIDEPFQVERDRALIRLRIDAVDRDARSGTWLYILSVEQKDGSWRPLCRPSADGRRAGFPLPGRTDATGNLQYVDDGGFELVCASGAQGKCVLRGYYPWDSSPDHGSRQRLFNACVRMFRADYLGSGASATRDGRTIFIHDKWDTAARASAGPFRFEAGWDEKGAVCVHHVRIASGPSLRAIEARSSRLKGRNGRACTQENALKWGALIFSGSIETFSR